MSQVLSPPLFPIETYTLSDLTVKKVVPSIQLISSFLRKLASFLWKEPTSSAHVFSYLLCWHEMYSKSILNLAWTSRKTVRGSFFILLSLPWGVLFQCSCE